MKMRTSAGNTRERPPSSRRAGAGVSEVELELTRADIEAMPEALRHQLLAFVEERMGLTAAKATSLERDQVATLLREISFHEWGRDLRLLLHALAYTNEPARQKLLDLLPKRDRTQLDRYIATLNRLAAKVVNAPTAQLCCLQPAKNTYSADPRTRHHLRDLLPGIERAGENEEPLWE